MAQQAYRAGSIDVEGDASAASYFAALATLHGARITLSNLGHAHPPGGLRLLRAVRKTRRARAAPAPMPRSSKGPRSSTAGFDGDVDMTSMPDVAPTLMMLAPFLARPHAHHRPRHAARQGMRPHRRAHARVAQARRHGGGGPGLHGDRALACVARRRDPTVVEIETYHDHRIAMSFGVLGSRLPGLRILDPGCVAKTYPNYWRDWQRAERPRQRSADSSGAAATAA